jgi:hypothetical protein
MYGGITMKTILISILLFFAFHSGGLAQTVEERIKALEDTLKKQEETIKAQQKLIEDLKAEMKQAKNPGQQATAQSREIAPPAGQEPSKPSSFEKVKEVLLPKEGEPKKDILSYQVGGATLRLVDVSLDALISAGTSTATDPQLQLLQGGGHDPRKRGFTVQNVELSLMGAVDPYLNAEAHIVYFIDPVTGDSQVELEEAFFTTQKLPYGLQLKGGQFLTEFGIINPSHPHQWDWLDQPIINTRLFGPDGMRAPGARLAWLAPLPWFSELYFGMQNANGSGMASFLGNESFFQERSMGGRPFVQREVRSLNDLAYLGRWVNSWDLSDELTLKLGFSGTYGPNATGPDGQTLIYGADLKMKWRPVNNFRGWPFVLFQSEVMRRNYYADSFFMPGSNGMNDIRLPKETLYDWGFYAQLLWGFRNNWATGIRFEYASGDGCNAHVDSQTGNVQIVPRNLDPFRDDRYRISPLLLWQPTEFSRFRLQYNYDRFKFLSEGDAHTVWLGVEFMLGAHAAHKY